MSYRAMLVPRRWDRAATSTSVPQLPSWSILSEVILHTRANQSGFQAFTEAISSQWPHVLNNPEVECGMLSLRTCNGMGKSTEQTIPSPRIVLHFMGRFRRTCYALVLYGQLKQPVDGDLTHIEGCKSCRSSDCTHCGVSHAVPQSGHKWTNNFDDEWFASATNTTDKHVQWFQVLALAPPTLM